ncbi:MAG: hypothetical protein K5744_09215 [Eubacterium sp.]|nr:hypothetical protein [Eubacterium sp.]
MVFESLFKEFKHIVVFDIRMAGLIPKESPVVEMAACRFSMVNGKIVNDVNYETVVNLSSKNTIDQEVMKKYGISKEKLDAGIDEKEAVENMYNVLCRPSTLLVSYGNPEFIFLADVMNRYKKAAFINDCRTGLLDIRTVLRDRGQNVSLSKAIEAYGLGSKYNLSNQEGICSGDKCKALATLLLRLHNERDDLYRYQNWFGYDTEKAPAWKLNVVSYVHQSVSNVMVPENGILPLRFIAGL